MSDEPKTTPAAAVPPVPPVQPAKPEPAAAAATSAEAANLDPAQLKAMIVALQGTIEEHAGRLSAKDAQIEAANDKVLRSLAELDNLRKRTEREKEETARYAITKFARDVVNVADNFERAINSVPAEEKKDNPALVSLIDGVTLTEREFLNVLERHGVKRISPAGEAFNPHHHQAVMEVLNPDVPAGTVLQVFQPGYLIDDRVLRPAMVTVATGGAKAGKPAAASEPGAGDGA